MDENRVFQISPDLHPRNALLAHRRDDFRLCRHLGTPLPPLRENLQGYRVHYHRHCSSSIPRRTLREETAADEGAEKPSRTRGRKIEESRLCRRVESDHRPKRYECFALTTELRRHTQIIVARKLRAMQEFLLFPAFYIYCLVRGGVTVARKAHNLEVAGSIPAPATRKKNPSGVFLFEGIEYSIPPPYDFYSAPVAQWIVQRPSKASMKVRFLPGVQFFLLPTLSGKAKSRVFFLYIFSLN